MADDVLGLVVHAADLHLGAPLDSLGRHVPPERAAEWRALAATALERLTDLTIDREADALILAGDVYDGADREVGAQLRFGRALQRLAAAGVRVFVAHGNHDPLTSSFRPATTMPAGVTVFQPGDVQTHTISTSRGAMLDVAGVSFGTQHETENLAARFAALRLPPERCIGVLHANVEGATGHDPYAPCTVADLERAPVAYWALGHVHRRTIAPLGPGRWWAYPGNLQGRSTKPTECGPKGALVVPFRSDGVGEPEFVACDGVRFERLVVDVSTAADVGAALDLTRARATELVDAAAHVPLLIRAELTGATEAHHALLAARDRLVDHARDHLDGALAPGALLRIDLRTRPSIDRARLVERGDLVSALLERVDGLRSADGPLLDLVADVLDGRTLDLARPLDADHDARAAILDRAEQILVDRLVAS